MSRMTLAEGRKPRGKSYSVEEVIALVYEYRGVTDVQEVMARLDISVTTARRLLDAGVRRGELIRDEYDEEGRRLRFDAWRYGDAR